jgi:hypothetical protein
MVSIQKITMSPVFDVIWLLMRKFSFTNSVTANVLSLFLFLTLSRARYVFIDTVRSELGNSSNGQLIPSDPHCKKCNCCLESSSKHFKRYFVRTGLCLDVVF